MTRVVYLSPHLTQNLKQRQADHLIITPNPRAAKALGTQHQSLDGLARMLLRTNNVTVAPNFVVNKILHKLETTFSFASASLPTLRELLRTGQDSTVLHASGLRRMARLADLLNAYLTSLRVHNMIDEAEVMWEAAKQVHKKGKLLVTGYPRVGVADLHFLDAYAGTGSLLFLPFENRPLFTVNAETAYTLGSLGWDVSHETSPPVTLGQKLATRFTQIDVAPINILCTSHSDQESEVRAALREIKKLISQRVNPDDIVVVARNDRAYGPLCQTVALEYGLPFQVLYSTPFIHTRVGAWLFQLTDLLSNKFNFEVAAQLLRHPLCTELPRTFWADVYRRPPRNSQAWLELGVDLVCLKWPEHDTFRAYIIHLANVLERLGVTKNVSANAEEHSLLLNFKDALANLLTLTSTDISRETFLNELRNLIRSLTISATPVQGASVELHTPLSIFGARYTHTFVLGMAEGSFPQPIQDDPLIDFFERKQLAAQSVQLEGAAAAAQRERLSFWALLEASAKNINFSYPRQVGREALLPSVYFSLLGLTPVPYQQTLLASSEESRQAWLLDTENHSYQNDAVLAAAKHSWQVERDREGSGPYGEYDGVTSLSLDLPGRKFSATQLTIIGQCPFRWFAQNVLRLKRLKVAEEDLSPALRGDLYHQTLALTVEAALDGVDVRQGALDNLEWAFGEAEIRTGAHLITNWEHRRKEHLHVLRRVLLADEFIPENHEIMVVERDFDDLTWRGLTIQGTVDRIDRKDGKLIAIDYKTSGSVPKGAKNAARRAQLDVQLPLYIEAVKTILFPGDEVSDAYYYSLTKNKDRVLKHAKEDQGALKSLAEQVHEHLRLGSFPVDPDLDGAACTYCDFDSVCRRGPRLERKRTIQHADK